MNQTMFDRMIRRSKPNGVNSDVPHGDWQSILPDGLKSMQEVWGEDTLIPDIHITESDTHSSESIQDNKQPSAQTSREQKLWALVLWTCIAHASIGKQKRKIGTSKYLNIYFDFEWKHFKLTLTWYPEPLLVEYAVEWLTSLWYKKIDAEREVQKALQLIMAGLSWCTKNGIPPFKVRVTNSLSNYNPHTWKTKQP